MEKLWNFIFEKLYEAYQAILWYSVYSDGILLLKAAIVLSM